MLLKVLRIAMGVALVLFVGMKYDDKLLLEYVTANRYLQVILGVTIAIVAWKLGASRTRTDYAPDVYSFLVWVFGDPARCKKKAD